MRLTGALFVIHLSSAAIAAGQSTLPFTALTLNVTTSKQSFVMLEPIPLTLRVSNDTKFPVYGHAALDFESERVRLYVRPQGQQEGYWATQLSIETGYTIVDLEPFAPGETHQRTNVLMVSLDRLFPQPGRYELTVALLATVGVDIKSDPIEIVIRPPRGRDADAMRFIQSTRKAGYFLAGGSLFVEPESEEQLQTLADEFADTLYATYADYALGAFYQQKGMPAQAAARLQRVVARPDSPMAAQAVARLQELRK